MWLTSWTTSYIQITSVICTALSNNVTRCKRNDKHNSSQPQSKIVMYVSVSVGLLCRPVTVNSHVTLSLNFQH